MPSRNRAALGTTTPSMSPMTDSVMAISMAVVPVRIIPLARDARYIPPARAAGRITCVRTRAFHRDPLDHDPIRPVRGRRPRRVHECTAAGALHSGYAARTDGHGEAAASFARR